VLWIGEWGSTVAAAAVEVKHKKMACGKVTYHHARVLSGSRPRPSLSAAIVPYSPHSLTSRATAAAETLVLSCKEVVAVSFI
jgi:hypothetical protein